MTAGAQRATLVPDLGSGDGTIPVVAVSAGSETYGFPLSAVREILMPPPLTEVPRSAEHFLGVIAVRGEIITLVDLPTLLNLEVLDRQPIGRIILVDVGDELIGVAVDRVVQVSQLQPDQIEYASAMSADLSEYVVGVARIPSESSSPGDLMLILIDPGPLLGGLT
ncbi:MAG: CheW domain-containing protein [Deltaproteobacteria bacterium]|nr:CheW domain-containing protein [Deltaproteobacteria bacterium]